MLHEPVDLVHKTRPCSDDESASADEVPADFIDFDEADELVYVGEAEAHMCACSSPNTHFAKPCRSEREFMYRASLPRFGSDPTSLAEHIGFVLDFRDLVSLSSLYYTSRAQIDY